MAFAKYTAPGLTLDEGKEISEVLQSRLHDLNELHLSLKHAHWNVTGPGFIAVHEMIDPQVDTVRNFVDDIAERMATLGATPNGLAGCRRAPPAGRLRDPARGLAANRARRANRGGQCPAWRGEKGKRKQGKSGCRYQIDGTMRRRQGAVFQTMI